MVAIENISRSTTNVGDEDSIKFLDTTTEVEEEDTDALVINKKGNEVNKLLKEDKVSIPKQITSVNKKYESSLEGDSYKKTSSGNNYLEDNSASADVQLNTGELE